MKYDGAPTHWAAPFPQASPRTARPFLRRASPFLVSAPRRPARSLYRVARLPEALDRGVSYFSTYLQSYLRGLGLSTAATEETFMAFSRPVVPSVLAEELLAFDAIVDSVRADRNVVDVAARCPSKVQLFLTPEVLQRLDAHRQEWQFLSYHGYGKRERTTLRQYLDRLVQQLGAAPPHCGPVAACAAAAPSDNSCLRNYPLTTGTGRCSSRTQRSARSNCTGGPRSYGTFTDSIC